MLTRKLNDALVSIPALDQPYIIKRVRPFVTLSSPICTCSPVATSQTAVVLVNLVTNRVELGEKSTA